jgi:thiamine-monophosphate kinase
VADIVLLGSVPRGRALLRSGAQPGDAIYVTGSLGGAAAELALLEQSPGVYARLLRGRRSSSAHPHLFPQPRLAVGRWLLRRATAAIDISDGLSTDLAHLAEESHVAARIEQSLLPIHALAARNPRRALDLTLHGGEDYELLFTAPPNRRVPALIAGTPIHRIGSIVPAGRGRPRITLVGSDGRGRPLRDRGWEHFGQGT